MASNPQRRAALADAGLRVLAATGARGLTHRAVDAEAGVPVGTASNYFRSRDALLGALGERIMERIAPDERRVAELAAREPSVELFTDYVRYIVERTTAQPELTRALIELRLEAVRRPDLARILGGTLRRGYRDDVAFHVAAGLPGGAFEVALLHYAIDGFLLDLLSTSIDAGHHSDQVVSALVSRLVAAAPSAPAAPRHPTDPDQPTPSD
ncbi:MULTISPECIES: TetR/AcrR family transcriptional regulator [Micromonospora]|uniref:Transcriptional regulator, TetR family n=1 Tax=Micromonospora yangpuensis TaxID=683228 RepID=A0A1C6V1Z9_9ACTN|nr:TetR/AcrR family transcriptional regulator [Micromonospora yangpuensis]GGL98090.1 TetR family transcriptional regulator [Micromonospora yangpuensis]SCL60295.1 transcriptional regulator, TetR family [Micromonospora yangpuensis]